MPAGNRVRYELMRHFGYFVTESSEHFAEYVPWFVKADRPDLIEQFNIPLDEYLHRSERQIAEWDDLQRPPAGGRLADGRGAQRRVRRGHHQRLRDRLAVHVQRQRAATRADGATADRQPARGLLRRGARAWPPTRGIEPQAVGALPRHLAALMQTNVNVQGLTVDAALTGRREPAYHAAMLDPHTAAELSLDEIARLVDDLLAAHGDWIPALETAEERPRTSA